MANSRDILLKLVRIAMGWEIDFSLPKDVDWKEVLSLAQEQGVNAIAVDGLEIWMRQEPQLLSSSRDKQLLLQAIGLLQMVEVNNVHQLSALMKLSQILSDKGIPFMIMKGFACAQYYPNPKHRPCGDIDIYPGERYNESNQALADAGIEVDPYYYRHSAAIINNVVIENHRVLGDLRGPRKQTRSFEALLEDFAKRSIDTGISIKVMGEDIPCGTYPSADFNALFLPWHVSAHFAFERVTIRHLLDWALFMVHEGKSIDIDLFCMAKRRFTYGYSKMADILTLLSLRYLNIPKESIPVRIIEEAELIDKGLAEQVMDYFFEGELRGKSNAIWKSRYYNIMRIWEERWKYKKIYNLSTIGFLFLKSFGVIFRVGEND